MSALASTGAILSSYPERWWIAGGWALDLHTGNSRAHHDVDVAVLRQDQAQLHRYLSAWSLYKVMNGQLLSWDAGECLAPPVHEIHAEKHGERLEFLLNDSAGDRWLFRRNTSVSMPLSQLGRCSSQGMPYLCPHVVLLFKARNPRPIDEADFTRTLPTLRTEETRWLSDALEICHPGHHWLHRLRG